MLPNHAPLVIAEQFGTLEALHPGRIDLGLGRAPGTDGYTAAALRRTVDPRVADDFPGQLAELTRVLRRPRRGHHRDRRARATLPDVWLLGSSGYSAQLAGMLGLPFAFARHFSARNTLPALALYREHFAPSERLAAAVRHGLHVDRLRRQRRGGGAHRRHRRASRSSTSGEAAPAARRRRPTPSRTATPARRPPSSTSTWRATSVGDPDTVRAGIEELLEMTAADELMISTSAYDHADRRHSYELVAGLFA